MRIQDIALDILGKPCQSCGMIEPSPILEDSERADERVEILSGYEVGMSGTPSGTHQRIVRKLISQLDAYFDGKKCEPMLSPLSVDFTEKVRGIDNDFIRNLLIMKARKLARSNRQDERVKNIVIPDIFIGCEPAKMKDSSGTYYGIPSLIIEVRSPSTEDIDFDYKKLLYESCGVREYIIVINPYTAVRYVLGEDEKYRAAVYDSEISPQSQDRILTIPSSQFPELNLILTSSWFEGDF